LDLNSNQPKDKYFGEIIFEEQMLKKSINLWGNKKAWKREKNKPFLEGDNFTKSVGGNQPRFRGHANILILCKRNQ